MNLRRLTLLPLLLAAAWPLAGWSATHEPGPRRSVVAYDPAEDPAGARVIVKYRTGSTLMKVQAAGSGEGAASTASAGPQQAATMARRLGLALRDGITLGRRSQVLHGDKSLSSRALAARLAADPEVEYAVPDLRRRAFAVPNDPLFNAAAGISPAVGQWYLRAPDSTVKASINAVGAWDLSTGASSVTVAVLDTGVRLNHPDLAGKLQSGYDFIADRVTANDGSGRDADPSDPGDWTNANECASGEPASDSSWHGTQVSGLIGASTNNGVGMAGVGRSVMLLPVRVLGRCGGFDSDIIAGMRWAAGLSETQSNPRPAKVLNMSLGSTGSCSVSEAPDYVDVFNELTAAGVTVVVASGNDTGHAVGVPANCPGAIAVAGVRHIGTKVGYSNVGPEMTIAAPAGNCVEDNTCLYPLLTTTNSGTKGPALNTYSDSTNYSVGTSFATPLVAGTVGLMLSVNPKMTPAQIKTALRNSARPFPTTGSDADVVACHAPDDTDQLECYCTTSTCGAGLLDTQGAVALAAADRVFDWAESVYPQLFPKPATSGYFAPYTYRYYPATGIYLGTANGRIYLHDGREWNLTDVGPMSQYLPQAAAAGF
ncbi:S8 family peptidase [Aquabacterium sp.]|uniref:S8 family peptidase n=1 Tax=Aquabacterium sp. TaxID=1872578 RepID=UPI00378436DA